MVSKSAATTATAALYGVGVVLFGMAQLAKTGSTAFNGVQLE